MDDIHPKNISIDEYLNNFSPEIRKKLEEIRAEVLRHAPNATEKISYGMPAFYLNGNLVYFAAFKKHIGFYPTASGIEAFQSELTEYKFSKGAVQFPLDKPLPLDLIGRIVEYRVLENKNKNER